VPVNDNDKEADMAVKDKDKTNAWDQLLKVEEEVDKARLAASEAGHKLQQANDERNALLDERRRLAFNDARLVDHRGNPSDVPDNPVAAIDAKLVTYDMEDLALRYQHAKGLEEQAMAAVHAFIVPVFWELVDSLRPEAEAAVENVRTKMAEAHEAVEEWIGVYRRSVGLTHPMGDVDGRDVPGVEHASALAKSVRDIELPLPLPVRRPT
jgi:hypothetical protein